MVNFIELNVYYKGLKEIDDNDVLFDCNYMKISKILKEHITSCMTINAKELCYFEPSLVYSEIDGEFVPVTKIILKQKNNFFYIFTDMPYDELRDKIIVKKK